MSVSKLLLKGATVRTFAMVANILIGFIMLPFLVHAFGDEQYGLWTLVSLIVSFYGLMDLGLSSASQRYITRALEDKEGDAVNVATSTSFYLFALLGFIALIVTVVIISLGPVFFEKQLVIDVFQVSIGLMGFKFAIAFPVFAYHGLIYANHRFDIISYIELFTLILRTVLVFSIISQGYGVIVLALITLCTDLLGYILAIIYARKIYSDFKISRKFVSIKKLKQYFNYGKYVFITSVADRIRLSFDTIVISTFLTLSLVTHYAVAGALLKYFGLLMNSVFGVFGPTFTKYHKNNDWDAIREKFIVITELTALISFMIGGLLLVLGKSFIIVWMGHDYLDAYVILIVLAIVGIVGNSQRPSVAVLYAVAKHKYYANITVIEAIANLSISILLVREIGLLGVALGTLIPLLVTKLYFQPSYTCKLMGLSFASYSLILVKMLVFMLGLFMPAYFLIATMGELKLYEILIAGIIMTSLYMLLGVRLMLSENTKKYIHDALPRSIAGIYGKVFIKYNNV